MVSRDLEVEYPVLAEVVDRTHSGIDTQRVCIGVLDRNVSKQDNSKSKYYGFVTYWPVSLSAHKFTS